MTSIHCLLVVLAHGVTGAPEIPPESWQTLAGSQVTVEYAPQLRSAAEDLLSGTEALFQSTPSVEDTMANLAQHRDELLDLVADSLGLGKPTKNMRKTFDLVFEEIWGKGINVPDFRRLRLYSAESLNAALAGGPSVPGFVRDKDGSQLIYGSSTYVYTAADKKIQYHFGAITHLVRHKNVSVSVKGAAIGVPSPVVLGINGDGSLKAGAHNSLESFLDGAQTVPIALAGAVLHETAELAIVDAAYANLLPFGRWFGEGAANCIAGRCIENILGPDAAGRFLSIWEKKTSAEQRARVDLAGWPYYEYEPQPPEMLSDAYYAVATKTMEGLVGRYGEDIMLKVIMRIRTDREHGGEKLGKALEEVTGQSMDALLPRPQGVSSPGVAVGRLTVGPFKYRLWGSPHRIREDARVSLKEMKAGGLAVEFAVLCAQAPVSVEVQLHEAADATGDASLAKCQTDVSPTSSTCRFFLPLNERPLQAGRYRLEIIVNDTACRVVDVEIAEARKADGRGRHEAEPKDRVPSGGRT